MKNKMILTALAVAMAAPGVAIADGHKGVKFSGIVQQHLFLDQADENGADENDPSIDGGDVRLQVMASEKVGGLTGYGQYRLDAEPGTSNSSVSSDNVRVGVKGDFGNIQIGESMEVDFGEYANDIRTAQSISNGAIAYNGSFGPVSVEALYSPKGNNDELAVGVQGKFGPVTVGASTGTQKKGGFGPNNAPTGFSKTLSEAADESFTSTIYGAKFDAGVVTIAAHAWKQDLSSDVDARDTDTEGYAVKVSGNAGPVSVGVTFDSQKDVSDIIRLDLGTKAAGLDLGLRYQTQSYDKDFFRDPGDPTATPAVPPKDDLDSETFLRLSAAKKF